MEPLQAAALVLGGLVVVLLILIVVIARSRTTAHVRVASLKRDLLFAQDRTNTKAAGEREALLALEAAKEGTDRLTREYEEATALVIELQGDVDDLRDRLRAAEADLASARREADDAQNEVVRLEGAIDLLRAELAAAPSADEIAADEDEQARLMVSLEASTTRLEAETARVATLEEERTRLLASLEASTTRLDEETARAATLEEEAAVLLQRITGYEEAERAAQSDRGDRDRLIASEARRRDLEDRLDALHAVRAAEQRRAAEQAAVADRLHIAVGDRDARIDDLESDLKQAEEDRDDAIAEASQLQVELAGLKADLSDANRQLAALGEHKIQLETTRRQVSELEAQLEATAGSQAEIARLRRSLEAERARAERISRRAAEEAPRDTRYAVWDKLLRERIDAAVERDTARLRDQLEHLRNVVAEKEDRLRSLTAGTSGVPSITAIRGIGPVIAGILAENGITTIEQVAELDDEAIERLGEIMPVYPGRIRADDWVGQARSLL